ncbi:hypothetical protein FRC09_016282 [Ceratobasidium sp. 395]|nr:hypothetical protein FRC09_016282 [Ceratobasidium sp. 395]
MLAKLKRKSDRARDALRHMFRSPSPEPPAAVLEYTSWDGLQTLVRLLSDNPGHLSLLTSTIGRLSACVEMFDARARTRPEYSQLGMDMDELFSRLANDSTLYASHERIAPFAQRLEYEIQPLVKSEERNIGAEDDMTTNDLNKVLRHYRRIRTLFAVFLPILEDERKPSDMEAGKRRRTCKP